MATSTQPAREAQAIVLGGGISGIAAAIRLRRELGLRDVVLLERSDRLGGTWADNTYPGCACDIPSSLMSFEFALNPGWRRTFAHGPELLAYIQRVADEHDVPAITSFGTDVRSARWDEPGRRWVLDTSRGELTAPVFVAAPGGLQAPLIPDVPGAEGFAGPAFHTARWDHSVDLTGRRVVVVGSGASAIQVIGSIQPHVGELISLQRTPGWVMPKVDWRTTRLERAALRRFPALRKALRRAQFEFGDTMLRAYMREPVARTFNLAGRAHLAATVRDRELRRRLTPTYTVGCKRVMIDNHYYPALTRPNVRVVPHGLREVRPRSVVSADGAEHAADVIVWGTGFHASDLPFARRLHGRDGRTLTEAWGDNPRALMGASVSGFPNAFLLWGPNVGTACNFVMVEAQLNYVIEALRLAGAPGEPAALDVRPAVVDAWKADVRRGLARSTFVRGGCTSWYMDQSGDNYTVFGGTMRQLLARSRQVSADMFEVVAGPDDSDEREQRFAALLKRRRADAARRGLDEERVEQEVMAAVRETRAARRR